MTGAQVRDGSLRAADFNPDDLQNLAGPVGSTGPAGPAGPAGAKGDEGKKGDPGSGILRVSATGTDAPNYANDTVLISQTLPVDGGWLGWAQLDATNSGSDDWLNCGLFSNGQQLGGGGDFVAAGTTKHINVVGFGPAGLAQPLEVWCESGGGGTFSLTNVSARFGNIL